jgi:hypothetical protein
MLTYRSPYVVANAALTANSATINSTTEVTICTTGSVTLTAGRAYRIEYHGLAQHASANVSGILYLRFRRTSGAALIRNIQNTVAANVGTNNRNSAVDVATIVTPAATLTDTIYMTAARDTGVATTWVMAGTAGTPGVLTVTDVGPAADYPGIATFS